MLLGAESAYPIQPSRLGFRLIIGPESGGKALVKERHGGSGPMERRLNSR